MSKGSSRRRWAVFALLSLLASTAIALLAAELVVRLLERRVQSAGALATAANQPIPPRIYEYTPGGLRPKRFVEAIYTDTVSNRPVSIRTNALGYRGAAVGPKPSNELRILALGDSITFAHYLEEPDTWPAQLENKLAAGGRQVRVLNAGVPGASLREELLVLTETGLLTQPDIVLVGLYLNDAEASRIFPIPQGLAEQSALAKRVVEMRYADQAAADSRLEYERLSGRPFPAREFPPEAWRTDRDAFEALIARNTLDWGRAWFNWAWDEMRPDLEIMRGLSQKHGFLLCVVLFPVKAQVEADFLDDRPQRMFDHLLKDLGVAHLDLLPALRTAHQKLGHTLSYDQCHLTAEGFNVVTQAMARWIASLPVARSTDVPGAVTQPAGSLTAPGSGQVCSKHAAQPPPFASASPAAIGK